MQDSSILVSNCIEDFSILYFSTANPQKENIPLGVDNEFTAATVLGYVAQSSFLHR